MNTLTSNLPTEPEFAPRKWGLRDLGLGVIAALGAAFATQRYSSFMDIYELVILWACVPSIAFLGYLWGALRPYFLGCAAAAIAAVMMYGGASSAVETNLLLKYSARLISLQALINLPPFRWSSIWSNKS